MADVVAVVIDSAANFKKAIFNDFTANKHIPCVALTWSSKSNSNDVVNHNPSKKKRLYFN